MKTAFVHVPKTAGSIRYQFDDRFCLPDDKGAHWSAATFMNKHNHNHLFYTQVRDPYDVAASLYFHIGRTGGNSIGSNKKFNALIADMIYKECLSVDEFLQYLPSNSMYAHYYDKLSPKEFDCVGFSEDMESSVKLLKHITGIEIVSFTNNINPIKPIGEPYKLNYSREKFMRDNEFEYQLYFEGVERFNELCKKYDV